MQSMQAVVGPPARTVVALASVAILAAGCGSSGSTPTTPSQIAQAAKYTRCLRQQGLANFPDPKAVTENGTPTVTIAFPAGSTNAPQFNAATGACNHLYPSRSVGGTRITIARNAPIYMLAFARCVRRHGVADFPDPPTPGSGNHRGPPFAGVDWSSATVQAAAKACIPASHGVVTPDLLQRFENLSP
jgi:hypothetical protein